MSDTYIGPFGRILPISGRPTDPSPLDKHSRMIVSTAPRLPLPTKLNFGSDPMSGFTDPGRYESGSSARRTLPGTRPGSHEKLPSVSQLLTPGSTGPTGSPFSLGVTGSGSPVSPGHHSSHVSSYTESHQRSDSGHFQGAYGSLPVSQSRYASIPAPSSSPYGHPYQDTSRSYMSTDAQRPAQSVHSPSQGPYYAPPPQSHSYGQNKMPPMVAGQPHSDPANPTKPVMKVVGEQNIHGEGICYLYEDGSHVKKYIDGEAVNAQWGVTKAGKPRKRLAIACMTCREKKIKCDPGEPKCVQCDKSGRECRFQTA